MLDSATIDLFIRLAGFLRTAQAVVRHTPASLGLLKQEALALENTIGDHFRTQGIGNLPGMTHVLTDYERAKNTANYLHMATVEMNILVMTTARPATRGQAMIAEGMIGAMQRIVEQDILRLADGHPDPLAKPPHPAP